MATRQQPAVLENYKVQAPPPWVAPTVERLLRSLAPEHVGGLEAVVLSDAASVGKGKTQRVGRRKYRRNECLGFYHARSKAGGAWVQLVVDNMIPSALPKPLLWLQPVRDILVAKTLYHEIGHHLEETVGAAARRGEEAAEDWRQRLSRLHFRKRYWYLRPAVALLRGIAKLVRRARRGPESGTLSDQPAGRRRSL